MTRGTLLFRNLGRNKLRTALTLAAIVLPMLVFTAARTLVDLVEQFMAESDRRMRVAVHQKLTFTTYLPQRMSDEILDLAPPGYIEAICRTSWFGGRPRNAQATFPSMAVDRDTLHIVYPDYKMTKEQIEAFGRERRGAIIAKQLSDQMNWQVGDRTTLIGAIPPYPEIEFVIAAVVEEIPGPWFYFGLDYYDEAVKQAAGRGVGVNNFWLKCTSPEARQWALTEIDKHFENTEHETRTEMESTFFAAFAKSGGDWVGLLWNIGQMIVLVAVAVAFNTMSMAFRERTREIAVLRALGFSAAFVTLLMLSEGVLIGLLGGSIAALPLYALTQAFSVEFPGVGEIQITGQTAAIALGVSLICGLLAAIIPSIQAGRLKVAAALRKVV